jgi:hypothetical protein
LHAVTVRFLTQRAPRVRRIAEPEPLDRGLGDAALLQVPARLRADIRIVQIAPKEFVGESDGLVQRAARIVRGALHTLVGDLDTDPAAQFARRFGKR